MTFCLDATGTFVGEGKAGFIKYPNYFLTINAGGKYSGFTLTDGREVYTGEI
jgi:cystathionine beta-lyase family protein involved in aluminum resistance